MVIERISPANQNNPIKVRILAGQTRRCHLYYHRRWATGSVEFTEDRAGTDNGGAAEDVPAGYEFPDLRKENSKEISGGPS